MTIPIIILYIACFGLVLWQFFAIRQEKKEVESICLLHARITQVSLYLGGRITFLENRVRDLEDRGASCD